VGISSSFAFKKKLSKDNSIFYRKNAFFFAHCTFFGRYFSIFVSFALLSIQVICLFVYFFGFGTGLIIPETKKNLL